MKNHNEEEVVAIEVDLGKDSLATQIQVLKRIADKHNIGPNDVIGKSKMYEVLADDAMEIIKSAEK